MTLLGFNDQFAITLFMLIHFSMSEALFITTKNFTVVDNYRDLNPDSKESKSFPSNAFLFYLNL